MHSLLKKNIGPVGHSLDESVPTPVQVSVDREYILFGAQREGQMLSEIGMYIPHENKFIFSDHVSASPENSMICFEGYKKDFFTSIWTTYLERLPIDFEAFIINPLIFDIFFFNETLFFYCYGALKFKSLNYFKDNFKILRQDFYWEDKPKVEEFFEKMNQPNVQLSDEPVNETSLNNGSVEANSVDRQSTIDSQIFRIPSGLNETDEDEQPEVGGDVGLGGKRDTMGSLSRDTFRGLSQDGDSRFSGDAEQRLFYRVDRGDSLDMDQRFSQESNQRFSQEGSFGNRMSIDSGTDARLSRDFLENRLPLTQSKLLKGEFSIIEEEESHLPDHSKDFSKLDNQSTFLKSSKRKTPTTQTLQSNYFNQNMMNDDFFSKKNHFDEIDSNFDSNTHEEVSVFIQKHSGIQPSIDSPFLSTNQQQKKSFSNQVSKSLQTRPAPNVNFADLGRVEGFVHGSPVRSEDQEKHSSGQYIISSGFNKYSRNSQTRNSNSRKISEFETGAMAHVNQVQRGEVSPGSFLQNWDTLSNKRGELAHEVQLELTSDNIKELDLPVSAENLKGGQE